MISTSASSWKWKYPSGKFDFNEADFLNFFGETGAKSNKNGQFIILKATNRPLYDTIYKKGPE